MLRARRPRRRTWYERIDLNPKINQGLLAIILFVVSGLSLLSFFSRAGVAGQFIDSLLALAFGDVRYVFPLLLIVVAILLIKDIDYAYRPTHLIGVGLFFLSFNGLVHLRFLPDQMLPQATQGYGGGVVGLALAWPLVTYVSRSGAILVLAGLLLASLVFLFNTSLATVIELHKKLFLGAGWFGRRLIGLAQGWQRETKHPTIRGDYEEAPETLTEKPTLTDTGETEAEAVEARRFKRKRVAATEAETGTTPAPEPEFAVAAKPARPYQLPPVSLLQASSGKPTAGDIKSNAAIIKDTLHSFGIAVEMGEIRVGPTITQYALKPDKGVKLSRITALANDLALALAAHPIRIEAPIPGKPLVGIEVPNQKVAVVTLRELLENPEFKRRPHSFMIALGKDVAGQVWFGDLPRMPHLLIAGATGSGKTVCLNTIILSLLFQNTPETLRFILIDPKRVELALYNGIPHLLTPVVTDATKTVNALKWTIGEMDRRFDVLATAHKRDITSYNQTAEEKLPLLVLVIDELADLMAAAAAEVEAGIIRLAQMARAVGIHLIVATQRPSIEVITGLMKANIPARLAFSVASMVDSRTILDSPGAEKLLGRGDMLLTTAELSKPKRLQGAFVSESEMKTVVEYLRGDEPPAYDETIVSKGGGSGTINLFGGPTDAQDTLFAPAKQTVLESGKASASLLQRRLKVGYARAARLLDELEEAGIVGPADGAKPREVFTEHLRLTEDYYLPPEAQTLDAGGAPQFLDDEPDESTKATPGHHQTDEERPD